MLSTYSPHLPLVERLGALRCTIRAHIREASAPVCCGVPMLNVGLEIDDLGATRIRTITYECDACFRRTSCDDEVALPGAVAVLHAQDSTALGAA